MSRMATRIRTMSFASLLGLCASSAFAQSPADFINDASAKGMADIEASRLAHSKAESKEVKDYTIVVINDRTTANQHLAKIAKQLDLPVAPREEVVDKAKALMPEVKEGDTFDQAYAASQVQTTEEAIEQLQQGQALIMIERFDDIAGIGKVQRRHDRDDAVGIVRC